MRYALTFVMVLVAACKQGRREEPEQQGMQDEPRAAQPAQQSAARATAAPTRSDQMPRGDQARRPESALDKPMIISSLDKVKWVDAPPALPKGAQVAILEGAPPFPANTTFSLLARFPKNYTIPPHTHLVTERVTVLRGVFSFGHGPKLDRKKATAVTAGGVVIIPADHQHYAFTTNEETIISLNGVGPWEIIYVNPKDDPRPKPAVKPATPVETPWEASVESKVLQARDVKFTDPPASMKLQPGAKVAILEGDPMQPKTYTMRVQFPGDTKIPVHTHSSTERFMIIDGEYDFSMGDDWNAGSFEALMPSSVAVLPKQAMHYGRTGKNGMVIQVTGVGPFDMTYANPAEAPGAMPPKQQ